MSRARCISQLSTAFFFLALESALQLSDLSNVSPHDLRKHHYRILRNCFTAQNTAQTHADLPFLRFNAEIIHTYPPIYWYFTCTDIHHVPDENNIIRTLPIRWYFARVLAKIFKAINPHRNSAAHSILHYSYFPPAACVTLYLLHLSADILQHVYCC